MIRYRVLRSIDNEVIGSADQPKQRTDIYSHDGKTWQAIPVEAWWVSPDDRDPIRSLRETDDYTTAPTNLIEFFFEAFDEDAARALPGWQPLPKRMRIITL